MENLRVCPNSETSIRHVSDGEGFDSSESKSASFYQHTSARTGLTADACYFNAVFNDSSETYVDEPDTTGSDSVAVNNPSPAVQLTVPSSPTISTDGSQPFRRSHMMRSSFNSLRSLRTKLKHNTNVSSGSGTMGGNGARMAYCHLPTVGDLARSPSASIIKRSSSRNSSSSSSLHFTRSTSDDMRRSLRHKLHKLKITYNELRRLQTKVLQDKGTLDERCEGTESATLPENIPPKAAALLMEGFSRTNSVQSSLKVHRRPPPEANTFASSLVRVKETHAVSIPLPNADRMRGETSTPTEQCSNLKVCLGLM
uniref:Uncharacterized protein n=1 Tax=Anopheles culicifacies TaxID=139723 RepID=A0A182M4S7_9DIPT